jgi:hypothetical protein
METRLASKRRRTGSGSDNDIDYKALAGENAFIAQWRCIIFYHLHVYSPTYVGFKRRKPVEAAKSRDNVQGALNGERDIYSEEGEIL